MDYKSGFLDELNRKWTDTEALIEVVKKNRDKLEESLQNTKYADNAEDEIDKIIDKLNRIAGFGGCLDRAINQIKNL